MLGEDHLDSSALEFFRDQVLIREVARQPVRRQDQDGFQFALGDGVAQAVERRTIERLAAEAVILIDI